MLVSGGAEKFLGGLQHGGRKVIEQRGVGVNGRFQLLDEGGRDSPHCCNELLRFA